MKTTPKQYARALFESLTDKDKEQSKQIIEKFVQILAVNHDLNQAEKIIAELDKINKAAQAKTEVRVFSAIPLDFELKKDIANYIKERAQAKEVEIVAVTDKKLLGGVVLFYQDKILDASLKFRLKQLYKQMIK